MSATPSQPESNAAAYALGAMEADEKWQAVISAIRDALITDRTTGAGDYTEAEEYADRIINSATAKVREQPK